MTGKLHPANVGPDISHAIPFGIDDTHGWVLRRRYGPFAKCIGKNADGSPILSKWLQRYYERIGPYNTLHNRVDRYPLGHPELEVNLVERNSYE